MSFYHAAFQVEEAQWSSCVGWSVSLCVRKVFNPSLLSISSPSIVFVVVFYITTSPPSCPQPAGPEYARWSPSDVQQTQSTSQHSISSSTHSNHQAHRQALLHPRRLHLPSKAPRRDGKGLLVTQWSDIALTFLHHWYSHKSKVKATEVTCGGVFFMISSPYCVTWAYGWHDNTHSCQWFHNIPLILIDEVNWATGVKKQKKQKKTHLYARKKCIHHIHKNVRYTQCCVLSKSDCKHNFKHTTVCLKAIFIEPLKWALHVSCPFKWKLYRSLTKNDPRICCMILRVSPITKLRHWNRV